MKLTKIFIFFIFLIIPINLYAELNINKCNEGDIKGTFNLIIYSNSFINDPETFIVLDRVDDKNKIVPYASDFKYRLIEKVNEKEVIKITNDVLGNSSFINSIKCSVIYDKEIIVGYELKPLYFPWIFGIIEPVETIYKKEGDLVYIFIRLNPRVERQLNSGGDSSKDD
ncbi:MAG: hypothetical protein RMI30_03870 [Thermodesulfovibrio sp.]|nr:hypothetical protein [Thermodesulfovibrio sp.]MDW7998572.1 hypothetical protein [Thermodesulfovibrio sp.]